MWSIPFTSTRYKYRTSSVGGQTSGQVSATHAPPQSGDSVVINRDDLDSKNNSAFWNQTQVGARIFWKGPNGLISGALSKALFQASHHDYASSFNNLTATGSLADNDALTLQALPAVPPRGWVVGR